MYGCLHKNNVVVVIKVRCLYSWARVLILCQVCILHFPLDNMTISTCILFQAVSTLAVDTTLARKEEIEKGSDPHLPISNCWNLTDKVRTTISAGAGAVKQGVKKGTAAVRHGADAVKKGTVTSYHYRVGIEHCNSS